MRRALAVAGVVAMFAGGCSRQPARVDQLALGADAGPIGTATRQLIVGIADDWDAAVIELAWYQRARAGASWQLRDRWTAEIGHAGLAWGVGLHGTGAPAGFDGPIKSEGDGRAPAGVFALGTGFGDDIAPPAGSRWPWQQTTAALRCVDDPDSAHYNQLIDDGPGADWRSAEQMRRADGLHRFGLVVAHNATGTPGRGSCIFFHLSMPERAPTVGCTALPAPALTTLLVRLNPRDQPRYVLLPRAIHAAVRARWQLP